jgi:hypothetical protein
MKLNQWTLICSLLAGCAGYGQIGTAGEKVDVPYVWGITWASGARPMALGGAFTAVADGQTALYYNPAGLGSLSKAEAWTTLSQLNYNSTVQSIGKETEMSTGYTKLNDLGLSVPVSTYRGSLAFGFSYHRLRQMDASIMLSRIVDRRTFGPYDTVTVDFNNTTDGSLSNTSFGASIEAAPGLLLGLSMNIWGGSREYNCRYTFTDNEDLYYWSRYDSTDHSMTRFSGLNFTLGMLYKTESGVNIGAVLITPVTLKGKEDWDYADIRDWEWNTPDTSLAGWRITEAEDSGYWEYKIRSPWTFRLGGSLNKGPLMLSADIEWIDYSQIKYLSDLSYDYIDKFQANELIRRELRQAQNIYLGAELSVPEIPLKLRGGYTILENPIKTASQDKIKVWSAGAGFIFSEQFGIDAAYARTNWEGVEDALVDHEKIDAGKWLITLSYFM